MRVGFVTLFVTSVLSIRVALACEPLPMIGDFRTEPGPTASPAAPEVTRVFVHRSGIEGCRGACADYSGLWIDLGGPAFPRDPGQSSREHGLRIEHVSGGPADLIPTGDYTPLTSESDGKRFLLLILKEGGSAWQPPIDVVLHLRTIDRHGNVSEPVEVHVTDPGKTGCASFQPLAPALLALALARRFASRR